MTDTKMEVLTYDVKDAFYTFHVGLGLQRHDAHYQAQKLANLFGANVHFEFWGETTVCRPEQE